MLRLRGSVLAAGLLAALSQGCSQTQPAPKDTALASQRPAKTDETAKKETANTLEAAEKACKEDTKRKGIASVVGIFSRLRPGSADEDYRACMKGRGFEVKS
jgi:hypothetical protein